MKRQRKESIRNSIIFVFYFWPIYLLIPRIVYYVMGSVNLTMESSVNVISTLHSQASREPSQIMTMLIAKNQDSVSSHICDNTWEYHLIGEKREWGTSQKKSDTLKQEVCLGVQVRGNTNHWDARLSSSKRSQGRKSAHIRSRQEAIATAADTANDFT